MIELDYAEVSWALNAHCSLQCSYCHSQYKGGDIDKSVDQYLSVVEKLQSTRYRHHSRIYWKISGGEPLQFPHLGTLLKKMKEKPCIIQLDTSGDDNWFSFFGVSGLIDSVKLTYHAWQNDDVFGFILEQCQEKNVKVSIEIPLIPGRILESRQKVKLYIDQGYDCNEQVLRDLSGNLHHEYSTIDANRINGRPDDWIPEPITFNPSDLSITNNTDPVYTGKPCYAGVDWLYINPKGFASYSQCGGRNEHYNAFDPNWQPPGDPFPCTVNQCRSEKDRTRIRIIS